MVAPVKEPTKDSKPKQNKINKDSNTDSLLKALAESASQDIQKDKVFVMHEQSIAMPKEDTTTILI